MNNFIILDGKQYKTLAKNWAQAGSKPATVRPTLLGEVEVTFGSTNLEEWQGQVEGPASAAGPEWGTIEDLRATLIKTQAVVLVDHYGKSYDVAVIGQWKEESLTPMWDGMENIIYVPVRLVKIRVRNGV